MLLLLYLPNVCESGRFRILLLYPLSGCLTFGITLSVLPSHQGIIRHNEYYVKPPIWFEQTTDGLQNHCSTTELQGQTPHLGNAPSYLELTVRPIRLLGREEWWWRKCDISHKDITGTYPRSLPAFWFIFPEQSSNGLGGTRTPDQFIRSELLYPSELLTHKGTSLFVHRWEAWEGQDLYEVWTPTAYESIIGQSGLEVNPLLPYGHSSLQWFRFYVPLQV